MINDLYKIKEQIEEFDESLDLDKLVSFANQFYGMTIEKENNKEMILSLLTSRTNLESCLTILKGIISPTNNKLISSVSDDTISLLNLSFDSFMAILDLEQIRLSEAGGKNKQHVDPFMERVSIKNFRELLIDYMENIVVFSLLNACERYVHFTITQKDLEYDKEELFAYLLLKSLIVTAKIKGSETRQKIRIASQTMSAHFTEKNILKDRTDDLDNLSNMKIPPDPGKETKFEELMGGLADEDVESIQEETEED